MPISAPPLPISWEIVRIAMASSCPAGLRSSEPGRDGSDRCRELSLPGGRGQGSWRLVKYLLKIDLLCFDGQPGVQLTKTRRLHDQAQRREGSAAVSDAGAVSPVGAGVCGTARAGRRGPPLRPQCSDDSALAEALAAGRGGGTGALLSAAPGPPGAPRDHRAHSPSPPGVRLRRGAHTARAPAPARGPARHGHDSAGVSRHGPAPPATNSQTGTPPDETLREGGAGRVDSGRREIRADRRPLGVSVHGLGRLHALPRPAALPTLASPLEPRLPRRGPAGLPVPDPAAAV